MAVEANLRSKYLYKIQLYMLKVIPMVMAFICLANSILSYYEIDLEIFSYIGSCSILMLIYLYVTSYVFRFCEYHRMFLHYIVITSAINIYDYNVEIPLDDKGILVLYMIIACVFLFLILYLYVKNHKNPTTKDSR